MQFLSRLSAGPAYERLYALVSLVWCLIKLVFFYTSWKILCFLGIHFWGHIMDLAASCKEKLAYFRIKELKDVLTHLGLSKQGKKQDMVHRILSILSDDQVSKMWAKKNAVGKEQVAQLVDDIYRKMQVSTAPVLASKGQVVSDSSNVKAKGEDDRSFQSETKVRCVCGNQLETESMIQCEDRNCQVWQHINCVIIPEKPMEGSPPYPDPFYCELCRLSRADPFWHQLGHPLPPVKLTTTNIPTDGTNPVQSVERTFQLHRSDKDLTLKQEFDVQAWCMLLNDKVSFRMQWPQYADLQVNDVAVRAINRPGSQLLGANGRDDGPIITKYLKEGLNKIYLTGCDACIFCLGVRLVKRRTVQQILSLIPKESDGERFEDALARVRRCVGGVTATDNVESDSDLEIVADSFVVNLRCPMSGSRMKVAGRFKPCAHMGCFDLEVFVEMNQRSRKWQCPICLKNYSLEYVVIDPYFNRIISMMRHCGEDVTEIEVKPDGSWQVKAKNESERRDLGELAQWHFPDGTICLPSGGDVKAKTEMKQVKQEGISDSHPVLKLEIKNSNGICEVSKPDDMNNSADNELQDGFGNYEQKVIQMSSSATGSGRDGEDPSVNQDGGGHFDFTNNGVEMDSLSLNVDSTYEISEQAPPAPIRNSEVIEISDSDDDDMFISSRSMYNNHPTDSSGVPFSMPPLIPDSYTEDPALGTGGTSCLGPFSGNYDEFGMPPTLWHLPPENQAGPGFQLFGSDGDVADALIDLQHGSMNCSSSTNVYTLAPETAMGTAALVPNSSIGLSDTQMNDGWVDNPLAFAGDDPSLQIFLPTRPIDASIQSDFGDHADVSNGVRTEDWISLRLGGGAGGNNGKSAIPSGLSSKEQVPARDSSMNSLADHASLLLGMNDGRSEKVIRQRSGSPFTFPRQKRSVRPKLLSIDLDSE